MVQRFPVVGDCVVGVSGLSGDWDHYRPDAREGPHFGSLKVYLYRDSVDFGTGINGLSILVEQVMRLEPMTSSLFVFSNRRRDRIKILGWDDNGFWLFLNRL